MSKIFFQITLFFFLFISSAIFTHGSINIPQIEDDSFSGNDLERGIEFPNTAKHITLIADLHTHSVFSDGHVWPNIRVAEAERDGIDVLAVTEHLEYQPHFLDIPHKDRNRSFQEASLAAKEKNVIVISGAEITREIPAGHINAILIQDANNLFEIDLTKKEDAERQVKEMLGDDEPWTNIDVINRYALTGMWPAESAIKEANKQGAFLFWNHPNWLIQAPDGIARLSNFHINMIKKNWLHGIEVVNGDDYSEEAFQIAIDNKLTLIGTSDVHNLIEWDYSHKKGEHRPVTLVFANNPNKESFKRALMLGRTVVWYKNSLLGLKKNLLPLLDASLSISSGSYLPRSQILELKIRNISDANFRLQNLSRFTFQNNDDFFEIPSHSTKTLEVKTIKKIDKITLSFRVLNALVSPKENAKINLQYTIIDQQNKINE